MTQGENVRRPSHERSLDLDKIALVLAARTTTGQPNFAPCGTEIDNDPTLRKFYLMTRSVLAVAFDRGELGAQMVTLDLDGSGPSCWMIVGQVDAVDSSAGDLAALIVRTGVNRCLAADLLVTVSRFDAGWRTQPGWVAIKNPVDNDDRALYNWVRPSFKWLRTPRSDGSEPAKSIVTARRMDAHPLKPMKLIFAEAHAEAEVNFAPVKQAVADLVG